MIKKSYRIRNLDNFRFVFLIAILVVLFLGGMACWIMYTADEMKSMLSVMQMVLISIAIIVLIGWIGVQAKYHIRADRIRFTVFGVPYRTIMFSDFPIILVTNAVFHIHSVSLADAMPMIDKAKTKSFGCPVCCPYLMAITRDYPLKDAHSGMSASDIISLNCYHAKSIGLCYASALETIRKNPAIMLCVQSDVLEHYPELFSDGCEANVNEGSEIMVAK